VWKSATPHSSDYPVRWDGAVKTDLLQIGRSQSALTENSVASSPLTANLDQTVVQVGRYPQQPGHASGTLIRRSSFLVEVR